MSNKATAAIVAGLAALLLVCGGGIFVLLAGSQALAACPTLPPLVDGSTTSASAPGPRAPGTTTNALAPALAPQRQWNAIQTAHASTIVGVGKGLNIPPRGWVIALATAMQESGLKNYANDNPDYPEVRRLSLALPHDAVGHDHDSVGLFQQRPIEGDGGWGTVAELMTPSIAAAKFYRSLQRVEGWETMPLGQAAQTVQRSGKPLAYDDDEEPAAILAAALAGVPRIEDLGGGPPGAECGPPDDGSFIVSPGGWTQPVRSPVVAPWGQDRGDHRHAGVDLGAPRNTPIHAAAAGTVVTVRCNAPDAYGCDRDGYAGLGGCGWYVAIQHAGNVQTWYCHMIRRPFVNVGDTVPVGKILGLSGNSGNSSGPHLHYEVHTNIPPGTRAQFSNSVDPVKFMSDNGAPLG